MATDPDAEPHRGSYRDATTHSEMLRDVVRTTAYHEAIRRVVKPGSRVIDFGAGTGALSILAARAGASHVDAIERESIVHHARVIARLNGCNQIEFHAGDHLSFRASEPADVLVSEWMGHCLFFESMLEPLIALRDRWLKPEGAMLPKEVSVSSALVIDEEFYEQDSFLQRRPYGIDWGPIAGLPLRQSRLAFAQEEQVMQSRCVLGRFDMKRVERTPEALEATLIVERRARTFGLLAWFEADLDDQVQLGTGPSDAPTHWAQLYLPFPEPLEVCPSRPISIVVRPPTSVEDADGAWSWELSDGLSRVSVDERDTFAHCLARGVAG